MRKGWRFLFWLAVGVVGVAIWVSWWAASGFSFPICPETGAADHCLSYDEIRAWPSQTFDLASRVAARVNNWAALIIAIFTAVLAVFTALLWRSTDKLWSVTNRTLEHAEQTTRKELRAYLSVEPLGINEYIGQNYLVGHFRIRNIGKIPAKDVSVYSTIALDADGKRTNFPIGTPRVSPTVLQPGAEMEFGSYEGWEIPPEQLDCKVPWKIKGYLYVWGEVLYTDELKTAGWTAFCHRYPCDMFGMTKRKEAGGLGLDNRRIHPKFARYHEEAGNEAG
ncbi:MAG: hypothetical protein ACM3PO_01065 [Betaproteobacteria bacterium]